MSPQESENPGFHAMMMAAAFAEEGLADAALERLGAAGGKARAPSAAPARPRPGLVVDAREVPPGTA